MKELKSIVGERIKLLRKALDCNQKEMCELLDLSQSNLAKIENGMLFPGFELMNKLHEKFNLNIDWLITGTGEMFLNNSKTLFNIRKIYPGLPDDIHIDELIEDLQVPLIFYEIMAKYLLIRNEHEDVINSYFEKTENKKRSYA